MHPILFKIPFINLSVHTYGFAIMVGFLAGVVLGVRKSKKVGVDPNDCLDLAMVCMVAGVIGARIFYVLNHPGEFTPEAWLLFHFWDILEYSNPLQRLWYFIGFPAGAVFGWWFFNLLYRIYVIRRTPEIYKEFRDSSGKGRPLKDFAEEFKPKAKLAHGTRIFFGLLFGVFVMRLLYVVLDRQRYDFSIINTLGGGLVLYGCIILSFIVGVFFVWLKRLPVLKLADISAPSYALGIAIGRLGCYFNGCCWGDVPPQGSFWQKLAITFPDKSPPYYWHLEHAGDYSADVDIIRASAHSLPVIPTQLVSAISLSAIFVLTSLFYYSKKRRDGDVIYLFGILYAVHRFGMEILRDDNPALATGMTISQSMSVLIVLVIIGLAVWTRKKFKPPHPFEQS
ncbi:prolipoprotein diacylglyceryl transferase [Planctomycetota bacterium]